MSPHSIKTSQGRLQDVFVSSGYSSRNANVELQVQLKNMLIKNHEASRDVAVNPHFRCNLNEWRGTMVFSPLYRRTGPLLQLVAARLTGQ